MDYQKLFCKDGKSWKIKLSLKKKMEKQVFWKKTSFSNI